MLSASRFAPVRLARPMARRPLAFALLAAAACAVAGAGFARFGVDAGSGLLVGRNSQAGQAYDSFSRDFGSDPIVVVLSADTPARIYTEANVTRLAIIEQDLARDSRVASVLGPGTIAVSSLKGIHDQVAVIDTEYGQYAGDAAEADIIRSNHWDVSKLTTDQSNQLSQVQQAASTAAVQALAVQVIRATSAAEQARS